MVKFAFLMESGKSGKFRILVCWLNFSSKTKLVAIKISDFHHWF